MRRMVRGACAALGATALCAPASAQEAIFTPSATQPSAGRFVSKTLIEFRTYDDDVGGRGSVEELAAIQTVSVGLTGDLSFTAVVPFIARDREGSGSGDSADLGDASLSLKYRVWRRDFGAVDTARASVFAGAEVPTGGDAFSSDSVDPFAGVVLTVIAGRHGFNQSVSWKVTTGANPSPLGAGGGLSDVVLFDSAYLFRVSPAEYSSELVASTYAVVEVNGVYETNGDTEVFLSPGILYEADRFALEAGVRIPIVSDVARRAESGVAIAVGIRFLF